jgi:copper transport protein
MRGPAPARRRVLGRAAVLLLVVLGAVLGGAAPASAHPALLFTDPAMDTATPRPLQQDGGRKTAW